MPFKTDPAWTPARYRCALAAWHANAPKSDADIAPVLAMPTLERLARTSPRLARTLAGWAKLTAPAQYVAANDNKAEPEVADELGVELLHEIRPTIRELLDAADADLVVKFPQPGPWQIRTIDNRPALFAADDVTIGRLVFRRGELVAWGETGRGVPLRPVERQRQPRGKRDRPRSPDAFRFLLPANDNAPIANGASFLGGRVGRKGNTSRPDNGDAAVIDNMARQADERRLRDALGEDARILDMAVTDATAREIGEAYGFKGKTAERHGVKLIEAAIEKLAVLAA